MREFLELQTQGILRIYLRIFFFYLTHLHLIALAALQLQHHPEISRLQHNRPALSVRKAQAQCHFLLGHGLAPLSIYKLTDRLKRGIDDSPQKLVLKHLELGCAVVRIGGFVVLIKDQQELFLLVVDDVSDECPEVVLEVELVDLMLHLL